MILGPVFSSEVTLSGWQSGGPGDCGGPDDGALTGHSLSGILVVARGSSKAPWRIMDGLIEHSVCRSNNQR
jgi:hypothetical protein